MARQPRRRLELDEPSIPSLAVHVVLDRSGSMSSIKADTIGGFNQYVETLKTETPDARLSLTLFDSQGIDTIINDVPIIDVEPLTDVSYQPRASTPLYDAIAHCVPLLDAAQAQNKALVILTDGQENASRHATRTSVRSMLEDKQENARWLVTYLGANQDAFAEGSQIGTLPGQTMNFSASGSTTRSTFASAAASVTRYARSGGNLNAAAYTAAERAQAMRDIPDDQQDDDGA